MAGQAAAVACRLADAAIAARAARASRYEQWRHDLLERVAAALERLADAHERRPIPQGTPHPPDRGRASLLAEIDQAVRSGRLEDAGARFEELAAGFPDDPAIAPLKEKLEALRRQECEGRIAQIQAARQVNDPSRVLELYRVVESYLERDRRGLLERELARWFLEVIHRRLRGGQIQPDVVELATKVAETFAATVEGASVQASLPTLRRSVGLCPRCAQPYVGTAAACPRCLAGSSGVAAPGEDGPPPDPDDATPDSSAGPTASQDDDWLFYDEDDGAAAGPGT